jgi:hypothetical protein
MKRLATLLTGVQAGRGMVKRILLTLLLFGSVSVLPALFSAAQAGGWNWQG